MTPDLQARAKALEEARKEISEAMDFPHFTAKGGPKCLVSSRSLLTILEALPTIMDEAMPEWDKLDSKLQQETFNILSFWGKRGMHSAKKTYNELRRALTQSPPAGKDL